MNPISKIGLVILLTAFIYLWNRYVVKRIVIALADFHKRNNAENLNRQPIKFLVNNEANLIQFMSFFYWIGGAMIVFGILVND